MAKSGKRKRVTKRVKATKPIKRKPAASAKRTEPKKRRKASGGSGRANKAGQVGARRASSSKPNRSGSSARKLTPQQKAAATRKAKASALEAKRARKSERQRQRRSEQREGERLARHERTRERDESDDAIVWLEKMTPPGYALDLTEAEIAADSRGPWLVVGKFQPQSHTTYADLWEVVRDWRDDLVLDTAINPNRISCIRIVYEDPSDARGSGDSVVSHFGVWDLVVSDMEQELNPNNPDSLAARYANSRVVAVYVYFGASVARQAHWFPHYQRDAA